MTASTLVYTWLQQRQQGTNTNPQLKYLSYFMPVVFLGVLNNYSAGLSYYYFVLNLLTIAQTYLMQYFIDKDKIEQKIHGMKTERSRKGATAKPKSRLESWLLEQQKKQQQMNRERNSDN